jgi:hypothetical protein
VAEQVSSVERVQADHRRQQTELICRRGPWKGISKVAYATLEWVDWFNTADSWR